MNVFIADDEEIIREGLKYIIEWDKLGFTICGESSNGEDTLTGILQLNPDLVLLDIRMPKLHGTEIVRLARERNFKGHFIILSGFSDFQYAQIAIRYGVDFYLTKPIHDEDLLNAVVSVKQALEKERKSSITMKHYKEKAKSIILQDILLNSSDYTHINLEELNLAAPIYQVVIYENYNHELFHVSYDFTDFLKVTNQGFSSFEHIKIQHNNIILLKGEFALKRFQDFLFHYESIPQKGSLLDSLFISYGRIVYHVKDIHFSYEDASYLITRRFFCKKNQHTLGYEQLPMSSAIKQDFTPTDVNFYCETICNYIQSFNRNMIADTLQELENKIFSSNCKLNTIKLFLTDFYLQVKQTINHIYNVVEIPFPTNSAVIEFIEGKYYLYEIILFFSEQFEMIMNAIGNSTSDSIIGDIVYYIMHNFSDNIKLDTIAPLFGYNSSYLGKIFNKKMGVNFNSYIDQVRINHSKELLLEKNLKVYEIATLVGYNDVDYFHKKFKKYVGSSPAEFRRNNPSS